MIVALLAILLIVWAVKRNKEKRREAFRQAATYTPDETNHSHFATDSEIAAAGLFKPGGIEVGESQESGKTVHFHAKVRPHIGLFGSSGIGKSSALERILLTWPHSAIVFDPTSEHAVQSGEWRLKYGPVYQWNPLRRFEKQTMKLQRVGIDPMGPHWMSAGRDDLDSRAAAHAASIISKVEGNNKYWYDSPRGLWATCEIAQVMHGAPGERNMPFIARNIINGDVSDWASFMSKRTTDPDLKALLHRFLTIGDRRPKSIDEFTETARTESQFLLNRAYGKCFSKSDITFSQFRRFPQTLYINSPLEASNDNVSGPANKLMLGQLLAECFQGEGDDDTPVLVIMDEQYQYGRDLEALPAAFGAGRKFKVHLLACITSLAELKHMYPNNFEVILTNLGMLQFLDASDLVGSEFLAKFLGEKNTNTFSKSLNYGGGEFDITPFAANSNNAKVDAVSAEKLKKLHVTQNYSQNKVPLMSAAEIRQELGLREQLVVIKELGFPMRLNRTPFYETSLRRRAKPSPYYRPGRSKSALSRWMEG